MNIYDKRWAAASDLVQRYKNLYDTGDYMVRDTTGMVFQADQTKLVIDYDNKEMYWETVDTSKCRSRYQIYEYDLDCDHGSYTKISEFKKFFTDEYRIFKYEPVDIEI